MDLAEAMVTRRSARVLQEPAPNDAQFAGLLETAAAAPDHGLLRPWRWLLIRGQAREELGRCLSRTAPRERREAVAAKPLRAPLMALLVFQPRAGVKVAEWEQLATASTVAYGMMLLLHASGFGSIWRTGALCTNPDVPPFLGLTGPERVLGTLDIGTPIPATPAPPRPVADVAARITVLHPGAAAQSKGVDPLARA